MRNSSISKVYIKNISDDIEFKIRINYSKIKILPDNIEFEVFLDDSYLYNKRTVVRKKDFLDNLMLWYEHSIHNVYNPTSSYNDRLLFNRSKPICYGYLNFLKDILYETRY